MHNVKVQCWQVLPTVIIAFITGYFFKWLSKNHSATDADLIIWISALGTVAAIVGAFFLGEWQIVALTMREKEDHERNHDAKRQAFITMIHVALEAINRLNDQYNDTREDRLRIRAAYHGDTFASLIEALAAIPMYELNSVDATIALAGFKKNMIEIQHLVDQFIADRNRRGADILFPSTIPMLDLRQYKAHAESHKQIFVNALKPID